MIWPGATLKGSYINLSLPQMWFVSGASRWYKNLRGTAHTKQGTSRSRHLIGWERQSLIKRPLLVDLPLSLDDSHSSSHQHPVLFINAFLTVLSLISRECTSSAAATMLFLALDALVGRSVSCDMTVNLHPGHSIHDATPGSVCHLTGAANSVLSCVFHPRRARQLPPCRARKPDSLRLPEIQRDLFVSCARSFLARFLLSSLSFLDV